MSWTRVMWRLAPVIVVLATWAPRQDPAQQPFRAGVEVVSIDVSVLKGKTPVVGLASDAFALLDQGVRQRLDAVVVETLPIDLTLIIDVGPYTGLDLDHFKSNIRKLAGFLRPVDRVRVITFGTDVHEIVPMQPVVGRFSVDSVTEAGHSSSLNDALLLALVSPPTLGRRALVVAFTNGDNNSNLVDNAVIPAIARRADAVLHVVLPTSSVPEIVKYIWMGLDASSRDALQRAAVDSGGALHYLRNGVEVPRGGFYLDSGVDAFRGIFNEFRQSYVLRYTVQGVPRGGWHDVTVTVVAPGADKFTVRARRGYFGG